MNMYYHPNGKPKTKPDPEKCKNCEYLKIIEDGSMICEESVWYKKEIRDYVYLDIKEVPYCPLANGKE